MLMGFFYLFLAVVVGTVLLGLMCLLFVHCEDLIKRRTERKRRQTERVGCRAASHLLGNECVMAASNGHHALY